MANEIYDSTWWGNTIQTASSIGTSTEMIQGQFNLTKIGDELVTNGDFATDSDWGKASGWSISGGVANANTTAYRTLSQNIPITLGKKYKVVFDVVSITSGGVSMTLGADSGILRNSVGTYSEIIEYNNFYSSSGVRSGSQGFVGSIDNVSVKEVRATEVEASKCLADAIHRIGIQDIQN